MILDVVVDDDVVDELIVGAHRHHHHDSSKVVLWLDPHESVASYAPLVRQLDRQVTFVQIRTSTEANMLMTTRSAVLQRLAASRRRRRYGRPAVLRVTTRTERTLE